VLLAFVLLGPAAVPSSVVGGLTDLAQLVGVPAGIPSGGRVEFVTNAVMLMPVSALGLVAWPRTNWRDWTACAFVIAALAELAQAVLLRGRSATFVDIVANTLGGAAGAGLVGLVRWWRGRG
jgi:glycopeptide antibiotics resistance protein